MLFCSNGGYMLTYQILPSENVVEMKWELKVFNKVDFGEKGGGIAFRRLLSKICFWKYVFYTSHLYCRTENVFPKPIFPVNFLKQLML